MSGEDDDPYSDVWRSLPGAAEDRNHVPWLPDEPVAVVAVAPRGGRGSQRLDGAARRRRQPGWRSLPGAAEDRNGLDAQQVRQDRLAWRSLPGAAEDRNTVTGQLDVLCSCGVAVAPRGGRGSQRHRRAGVALRGVLEWRSLPGAAEDRNDGTYPPDDTGSSGWRSLPGAAEDRNDPASVRLDPI